MYERPYDLVHGPDGYRVRIRARGRVVLASAMLNRGTAFTVPERRALRLTGLLPGGVTTLASQLRRRHGHRRRQTGRLHRRGRHASAPGHPGHARRRHRQSPPAQRRHVPGQPARPPTILIGTSTQAGAFTEQIVKNMAAHVDRPIIMPLSNPTSKAEALPAALIRWTDGRALVAAGGPFPPVDYGGRRYRIGQANNALVFPGIGLGVTVARARRISVGMISAAASAIASLSDLATPGAALLPPVDSLRLVSATIGVAVAQAAAAEGLADRPLTDPIQQVHEAMWRPEYPDFDVI